MPQNASTSVDTAVTQQHMVGIVSLLLYVLVRCCRGPRQACMQDSSGCFPRKLAVVQASKPTTPLEKNLEIQATASAASTEGIWKT